MERTHRRFRSAVIWAFLMNWGLRGFSSLFVVILAAFVGPTEFGLMGIAMAYILFARMLLEQGLTSAVVQRKDLTHGHLNAVFWVTMGVSVALCAASWLLAGWWASVQAVDSPQLASIIRVLALTLPLTGLTIVQQADLRRRMDFKSLAVRSNVSVLIGGVAGIASALMGAGVWALVVQSVTFSVVSVVLLWSLGQFRPALSFSFARFREIASFSGAVFVDTVGNFVNRQADAIVMGLFFGPATVGLYQVGARLRDLVVTLTGRSLTAVSLPEFSRFQDDPEAMRKRYLHVVTLAGLTTIPPLALLAACGDALIEVLGSRWAPQAAAAGAALALLCMQSVFAPVGMFTSSLLQASGRPLTSAAFTWAGAGLSAISYIAAGVLLREAPVTQQVLGIAGSRLVIVALITTPAQLAFLRRACGVRVTSTLRAVWPSLVASTAGGLLAFGARSLPGVADWHPVLRVVLCGVVFGAVCGPLLLALDNAARRLARSLLLRGPSSRTAIAPSGDPAGDPSTAHDGGAPARGLSGTEMSEAPPPLGSMTQG